MASAIKKWAGAKVSAKTYETDTGDTPEQRKAQKAEDYADRLEGRAEVLRKQKRDIEPDPVLVKAFTDAADAFTVAMDAWEDAGRGHMTAGIQNTIRILRAEADKFK